MRPLFHLEKVLRLRASPDGAAFRFHIPEFAIERGGIIAIVGPSGAGKSTLLNLLGGLEKPDEGTISIRLRPDGDDATVWPRQPFPSTLVGRVFQHGHLLPTATVAANIAVACEASARPYDRLVLAGALAAVELPENYLDRRAWQLSGGEAQRVSIARAFVADPAVVLCDEPTSSADPALAERIMEYFRRWVELRPGERTILWVTHHYRSPTRSSC
jgi:putative ABC transport system ATP-binding protein